MTQIDLILSNRPELDSQSHQEQWNERGHRHAEVSHSHPPRSAIPQNGTELIRIGPPSREGSSSQVSMWGSGCALALYGIAALLMLAVVGIVVWLFIAG
jgi:hypothetical protein